MKEKKEFIVKCRARDYQAQKYRTINRTVKVDFSEDTPQMFVDAAISALLKKENKDIFLNHWIDVIEKVPAFGDIQRKRSLNFEKSKKADEEIASYTIYMEGQYYPFPMELKPISASLPGKYRF